MQPFRCRHKGCKNTHKSTTGYCHLHVEQHAGHQLQAREGRRESNPHLVEEYTRGLTIPKVI